MWTLVLFILFISLLYLSTGQRVRPINGVYSKEGPYYNIKYFLFKTLLTLRKFSASRNRKKNVRGSEAGGLGQKSYENDMDKERPQPFSDHPNAFDAVFFSGSSQTGDYVVCSAERRQNKRINGIFYLMLPEIGLYRGSWLPRTRFDADFDDAFIGGGIRIEVLEPMRKWNVEFQGKVLKVDTETNRSLQDQSLDVKFKGLWQSDSPLFDYDTDMSTSAAARAFAKEEWNEQYFKDLQRAHQSHYEQLGVWRGTIEIPSLDIKKELQMQSFRDHSYGTKRDWKLMHRYFFHHIFLQNGWKAVVGVVCQPSTCTSLECGFVQHANGNIFPLDKCSLKLHEHGEGGQAPCQYAMIVQAGGHEYEIEVDVIAEAAHYYGDEDESRLQERMARYKVNGIPGTGITEWHYRNTEMID